MTFRENTVLLPLLVKLFIFLNFHSFQGRQPTSPLFFQPFPVTNKPKHDDTESKLALFAHQWLETRPKKFNALQKAWFTVLLNGYSSSAPHHTSQQQSDRIKSIAKMVSWWLILPAHLKQWRQETKLRWPVCCLQLPHSQYRSVPVTGLGPPESRYQAPPSETDRKSCECCNIHQKDHNSTEVNNAPHHVRNQSSALF